MIHPKVVVAIQKEVATTFGDPVGVRDEDALIQALARPHSVNATGIPTYPTFFNKLSVLFQQLMMTKPFAGSNRRTAFVILAYLLEEKGYELRPSQEDIDGLLVGVEAGFTTWHRVTAWIKGRTVNVKRARRRGNESS